MWNQRNADVIYELMAPDGRDHMMHGLVIGPDPFHEAWKGFAGLMPGMHVEIEETIEQGEKAVVRWRMTGQHEGRVLGPELSGAEVRMHGMT